MLEVWISIAQKLGFSEEDAMLLHAFNRGWADKLGDRKAYVIVGELVDRFGLDDREFDKSYSEQLRARGILTAQEAAVFAGDKYEEKATTQAADAETGPAVGIETD